MKKIMKKLIIMLLLFMLIILVSQKAFANTADILQREEYSKNFKKWLELSEEERQKVIMPKMYDYKNSRTIYKNPLYLTRMLGYSLEERYNLKDIIPSNLIIKDQMHTNSCWAFSAISSLETNLALSNYKNGINTPKVYDFSERHMEYATSRTFENNVINPIGYNRKVGGGGSWWTAEPYFINGTGAIPEEEMPFEDNEKTINISQIQDKTVSSQVYDTIYFEDYQEVENEKKIEIMNQIKQHIKNNGSVFALIHGDSADSSLFSCYNNETGAKYCNNADSHAPNHAISIVGWNDNYDKSNFAENARPSSNGAWIARNSWGERLEKDLLELKQKIYNANTEECNSRGWTQASLIPNNIIEQKGYTIDGNIAYIPVGDNGYMYISYEDVNISDEMYGIVRANEYVDYDNIYQYDKYFPAARLEGPSEIMMGNIFEKSSSTEYLTEVSLHASETYTCRVYVNPKGSSFAKSDLELIPLKAGESETFDSGYHTLEFLKPVELTGSEFAVVIEITSSDSKASFFLEVENENIQYSDVINVEKGKCFLATGHNLDKCSWLDLGTLTQGNSSLVDGNSTIKAFTTNELLDESLKNIEITEPPIKTSYFEGENFDKTGMVVKANYNSKNKPSVILDSSNYSITNGTNLEVGQTSVTITYEGKSVEQEINVEKNSVTEIKIKQQPKKVEYKEGEHFDKTGMVIEATFKNGSTKEITDYTIENGNNLRTNQTEVIISYGDKSISQTITVTSNPLIEINVTKAPNKTKYVV